MNFNAQDEKLLLLQVIICHKGKELCLSLKDAVDHLKHGDQWGRRF